MIKWLFSIFIVFCGSAWALTPIYNRHEKSDQVDDEFSNIYLNVQPLQFRVFDSTPNADDLQDGEMVIFSSGAIKLMLRAGTTVYQVNLSTIQGK